MVAVGASEQTVGESGTFGAFLFSERRIALVVAFGGGDEVDEPSFGRFGHVAAQSPISLLDFTVTEHVIEAGESLRGFGKHDKTTDRAIQAMDHTAKHVAGFVVFFFQPFLDCLDKRFVACLVSLDYLSRGLIYYNKVVVFVNNLHDKIFIPDYRHKISCFWSKLEIIE